MHFELIVYTPDLVYRLTFFNFSRLGLAQPTLLDLCRHVFSSLAPIAINELPVLAASLLVPIRTGTVRPCAPFSFTSQSSEVASVISFRLI